MSTASRLALGTVQLGKDYGIANNSGRPDDAEADEILLSAWRFGFRWLDTAQNYGDSEVRIGTFLRANPEIDYAVATKLAPNLDITYKPTVLAAMAESKKRLGRTPAVTFLHDPEQLGRWSVGAGQALVLGRNRGLTLDLGVSVYSPEEFSLAIDNPDINFIQAPFNALDPRLIESGLMARAIKSNKQIFIRSIFLQGLLLCSPDKLSSKMSFAAPYVSAFHDLCRDAGLSPAELAIRYVAQAAPRALLIIGCETSNQLRQNARYIAREDLDDQLIRRISTLPFGGPKLVNPYLWNR